MSTLAFYRLKRVDAPDDFASTFGVYAPESWRSGRWWYAVSPNGRRAEFEAAGAELIAESWRGFFDAISRWARARIFLVDATREIDAGGTMRTVIARIPACSVRATDIVRVRRGGKSLHVAGSALGADEGHLRYLPPVRFAGHPRNRPIYP